MCDGTLCDSRQWQSHYGVNNGRPIPSSVRNNGAGDLFKVSLNMVETHESKPIIYLLTFDVKSKRGTGVHLYICKALCNNTRVYSQNR